MDKPRTQADEARMILAEAGYPDAAVHETRDGGWEVMLSGDKGIPFEVWWRLTQTLAARGRHGCVPWCWACCGDGFEPDECQSKVAFESDCGRDR